MEVLSQKDTFDCVCKWAGAEEREREVESIWRLLQ